MRVWLFQTGEILPLTGQERPMRSLRLANELTKQGHEVLWWASAFDHIRKQWLTSTESCISVNGLKIIPLHGCGYQENLGLRRYVDHLLVARRFEKLSLTYDLPDVFVISLPDHLLAYAAARFAIRHHIPYILDLRDRWPWDIVNYYPHLLTRGIIRLALSVDYAKSTYCIRNAASMVTMMKSYLEWAREKGLRLPENRMDRVFPLGAPACVVDPAARKSPVLDVIRHFLDNAKLAVIYAGSMGKIYQPISLVKIARSFRITYPGIKFILVGEGEYFSAIKGEAQSLDNILLTGWMDQLDLFQVMLLPSCPKIGAITLSKPIRAFPNKAFTYLSAGLPIISMLDGDIASLIAVERVGINVAAGDEDRLANVILDLFHNPSKMNDMALRAKALFENHFSSEIIDREYAGHVVDVAQNCMVKKNQI